MSLLEASLMHHSPPWLVRATHCRDIECVTECEAMENGSVNLLGYYGPSGTCHVIDGGPLWAVALEGS